MSERAKKREGQRRNRKDKEAETKERNRKEKNRERVKVQKYGQCKHNGSALCSSTTKRQ